MTTEQALKIFTAQAKAKGMDTSGDDSRFFKLKTARAWTAFHQANCK